MGSDREIYLVSIIHKISVKSNYLKLSIEPLTNILIVQINFFLFKHRRSRRPKTAEFLVSRPVNGSRSLQK